MKKHFFPSIKVILRKTAENPPKIQSRSNRNLMNNRTRINNNNCQSFVFRFHFAFRFSTLATFRKLFPLLKFSILIYYSDTTETTGNYWVIWLEYQVASSSSIAAFLSVHFHHHFTPVTIDLLCRHRENHHNNLITQFSPWMSSDNMIIVVLPWGWW